MNITGLFRHDKRSRSRRTARIIRGVPPALDLTCQVAVVGGGACGLTAAIWARRHGAGDVVVLERDATCKGSTALSSGFVPAAGTLMQRELGIVDSPAQFAADIAARACGTADPILVDSYTREIGGVIESLSNDHALPFIVLDGVLCPGHTAARMHALPQRTGAALVARLQAAAVEAGVDCRNRARVDLLFVDSSRRVMALGIVRPEGRLEYLGCQTVILACNGFGGNPDLVERFLPEMQSRLHFGHAGNQGDAVLWAEALGAELADMSGYDGHGSVASPQGVPITWALIMKGGLQINQGGRRFWDESEGCSEAAQQVIAQPGGIAWNVYDEGIHRFALDFPDYRDAETAGAIRRASDAASLSALIGCPLPTLRATLDEAETACRLSSTDSHGRRFDPTLRLSPPYRAVRVTGALFQTQGGPVIDAQCRMQVPGADGGLLPLPNLFAAGGAARGVSGHHASGYLSGNGLLSALAGGAVAGREAAAGPLHVAPPR